MNGMDLRLARVRIGLTQFEFGLKLGVHPARLSEMETSKRAVPEEVVHNVERLLDAVVANTQ